MTKLVGYSGTGKGLRKYLRELLVAVAKAE
jgi:hypothetical protein